MRRGQKTFFTSLCLTALLLGGGPAEAGNPIGDFFKKVGNSIAHPQRGKATPRRNKPSTSKPAAAKGPDAAGATPGINQSIPPGEATALPSATPVMVRPALSVPQTKGRRRDLPYGVPVSNKAGFVTSPYAPTRGMVDVRGFPSGTEVKDPYTDKVFLAP